MCIAGELRSTKFMTVELTNKILHEFLTKEEVEIVVQETHFAFHRKILTIKCGIMNDSKISFFHQRKQTLKPNVTFLV